MKSSVCLCLTVVLVMISLVGSGQEIQRFDLGYEDFAYYNPAAAISTGDRETTYSKYALDGADGSGRGRLGLSEHAIVGVGGGKIVACVSTSRYSTFFDVGVSAGYAYGWNVGKGRVNLGALASLDFDRGSWEGAGLRIVPDVTLGMEYNYGTFRAGASVINALSLPIRAGGVQIIRNPRAYSVHASYGFTIPKAPVSITPYVFGLRTNDWHVDMGLYSRWNNFFSLAYAYRYNDYRHIVTAGINVPQTTVGVFVGYSWSDRYATDNLSIGLMTWL